MITIGDQLLKLCRVLSIAGSYLLFASGADAAPAAKVNVCHAASGNVFNAHPIRVGGKGRAVASHLNHGDWLVLEEMCDAIPDNDCDGAPDPIANDADCVAQDGFGATCISGTCEPLSSDTPVGAITEDINRGGTPPNLIVVLSLRPAILSRTPNNGRRRSTVRRSPS